MRRQRIFITGITGTLGTAVSQRLLLDGFQVVGYSRDEQKQRLIVPHENLTLYLGDIRDERRVIEATRDVDMIMHFAALKCVDTLEENPEEAVATNIKGTENVLAAQRLNEIYRVVLASTDKAVYPINVYGMSKGVAERLVLRNSNNVVCRYGNVVGSRGSVIPYFVKTLKSNATVFITDDRMSRFWIQIEKAADFVIRSSVSESGLVVPYLKSADVRDVARAVACVLGIKTFSFSKIAIRPGEKLSEDLLSEYEDSGPLNSASCDRRFTHDELVELVRPTVERCM